MKNYNEVIGSFIQWKMLADKIINKESISKIKHKLKDNRVKEVIIFNGRIIPIL